MYSLCLFNLFILYKKWAVIFFMSNLHNTYWLLEMWVKIVSDIVYKVRVVDLSIFGWPLGWPMISSCSQTSNWLGQSQTFMYIFKDEETWFFICNLFGVTRLQESLVKKVTAAGDAERWTGNSASCDEEVVRILSAQTYMWHSWVDRPLSVPDNASTTYIYW